MSQIVTYPLQMNYLSCLEKYILENFGEKKTDMRRLAIIFGGKRPALFLKRGMAKKINQTFYPPRCFSIDEFIQNIVIQKKGFVQGSDLEQGYFLFQLAHQIAPHLLKGRETFSRFLPWAHEILSFIEQIDLEDISDQMLRNIQTNAEIGYDVPQDINVLLNCIVDLRKHYHQHMLTENVYSRGFLYAQAARFVSDIPFDEFDRILFCNFFYLNQAEKNVIKNLYARNKAILLFQGDERNWPALKENAKHFSCSIKEPFEQKKPIYDLNLYSAFDVHSQICLVREILKNINDLSQTVIVLPNPDHMIPLLSEISCLVQDFNVSMGYPLRRSSFYSLIEYVIKAQLSKGEHGYYTRDYLKVLNHPFVKNLSLTQDAFACRVLVDKIEEILTGKEFLDISGRLFVHLNDIKQLEVLFELSQKTLEGRGVQLSKGQLQELLEQLHHLCFSSWENINHFKNFVDVLEDFLNNFTEKSCMHQYPLNIAIAAKIFNLIEEFKHLSFIQNPFPLEDIYRIYETRIKQEIIAFSGSPLKGLQILGLFETRSLNFENVIILDVNEGVLPHINIYEPLIPREVMISLNLHRLEQEEEIQRYQFLRLISSAKKVHLIYQENRDKEKSRFIEELIWNRQREANALDVIEQVRPCFSVKVTLPKKEFQKTPEILSFLERFKYSASSINTYLCSPVDFYYKYVLGIKEEEDLLAEPENRQIGIFIHELLENSFKKFVGRKPVIDEKFKKVFWKDYEQFFSTKFGKNLPAEAFLLKSVLDARLKRFLENEASPEIRPVSEIVYVEKCFQDAFSLACGNVNFIYRVDRVDRLEDGSILILDYKTGYIDPMPKAIDRIEKMVLSRGNIFEAIGSFQIPLYFNFFNRHFKTEKINAAFYNLRTLELHKFIDRKMLGMSPERINQAFERCLEFILSEILNPDIKFSDEG